MPTSRVHLVDADPAIQRSVPQLLATIGLGCATFDDGARFLESADHSACTAVIVEARLPGVSGFRVLERLVTSDDPPAVIMISCHGEIEDAVLAIKLGAIDFLPKPLQPTRLLDAVQSAVALRVRTQDRARYRALIRQRMELLTDREREVMQLVVGGLANKQVASALGLSQRTVECHRNRVMQKMKVDSLADLVRTVAVCPVGQQVADSCGVCPSSDAGQDELCETDRCRLAVLGV